jgi:hypothetical protein
MKLVINILLLLLFSTALLAESLPDGWRHPNDTDMIGAWAQFRKELPDPYHVIADFNGDGVLDHIWMLIREKNNGIGIFAFIGSKDGKVKVIKVLEQESTKPQRLGLLLIMPGQFNKTSCGKGFSKCYPGGAVDLKVESPVFELFMFNGTKSSFYRWNESGDAFSKESIED